MAGRGRGIPVSVPVQPPVSLGAQGRYGAVPGYAARGRLVPGQPFAPQQMSQPLQPQPPQQQQPQQQQAPPQPQQQVPPQPDVVAEYNKSVAELTAHLMRYFSHMFALLFSQLQHHLSHSQHPRIPIPTTQRDCDVAEQRIGERCGV